MVVGPVGVVVERAVTEAIRSASCPEIKLFEESTDTT